jgi:hypothetical protein
MPPLTSLPFDPSEIEFHLDDAQSRREPGAWVAGAPSAGTAVLHGPAGPIGLDLAGLAPAPYLLIARNRALTVLMSFSTAGGLAALTDAADHQPDLRTSDWYWTGPDEPDAFRVRVLRAEGHTIWQFELPGESSVIDIFSGPPEDASATFGAYAYLYSDEHLSASAIALDVASGRIALNVDGRVHRTEAISPSNAYRLAALIQLGGTAFPGLEGGGVCVGRWDAATVHHEHRGVRLVVNRPRRRYMCGVAGADLERLLTELSARSSEVFPPLSSLHVVAEFLE